MDALKYILRYRWKEDVTVERHEQVRVFATVAMDKREEYDSGLVYLERKGFLAINSNLAPLSTQFNQTRISSLVFSRWNCETNSKVERNNDSLRTNDFNLFVDSIYTRQTHREKAPWMERNIETTRGIVNDEFQRKSTRTNTREIILIDRNFRTRTPGRKSHRTMPAIGGTRALEIFAKAGIRVTFASPLPLTMGKHVYLSPTRYKRAQQCTRVESIFSRIDLRAIIPTSLLYRIKLRNIEDASRGSSRSLLNSTYIR